MFNLVEELAAPIVEESGAEQSNAHQEIINSRFGPVAIFPDRAVNFASGLFGMPEESLFCVGRLTDPSIFFHTYGAEFFILQSLTNNNLSFIMLPIDVGSDNPPIPADAPQYKPHDLTELYANTGFSADTSVLFCIATVYKHNESGDKFLTVNAKAPIISDTLTMTGLQYVIPSGRYQIRHHI